VTHARTSLAYVALSLLMLILVACGRGEAVANNQGNEAFETGDFDAALQGYEEVQELAPDRAEPFYNSANVRYRNDEHDLAQEDLQQALLTADDDLARATLFNQGNSFFESDELGQAVESYIEVLRMDPDDQDAKYNLELALRQQEEEPGQEPEEEQQEGPGEEPQEDQEEGDGDTGDEPDQEDGEGEPQDEPGPGEGEDTEPGEEGEEEPGPGEPQPTEISEEQAERLLDSIGQTTETLQSAVQGTIFFTGNAPERDW
jgi:Ca-activated chloride channel family protein